MKTDDIGFDELLALYAAKATYIREANLCELINLKRSYPELFDLKKEIEVYELLDRTKYLIETPHFKAMLREDKKRKLIPLDHNEWQVGGLAKLLEQHTKITYSHIHAVSREAVKEAIVVCRDICEEQEKRGVDISTVFPFLGFFLTDLLIQFPTGLWPITLLALADLARLPILPV
jgi:hypothetical protein